MSRARDLANGITTLAPLASPDFTGTVDLTGTTISLDNDQISGDKVSGGEIGAGTFNGTIGDSATFPAGHVIKVGRKQIVPLDFSGGDDIPRDNTIPLITEGGQVIQYDYTPKDTTGSSILLIQANFWMGERANVTNKFTVALFIDDTCVSVQSHGADDNTSHWSAYFFQHYLTHSGTVVDVEIRADDKTSVSVNPQMQNINYGGLYTSGSSSYGGSVSNSELIVWEITA